MREKLKKIRKVKLVCFFTALGILSVVGALWFWRPEVSEIEKRELADFPKLTAKGVMDGSFAAGVDRWYADTYPLREAFIAGNHRLQALYGDRSEQIILDGGGADDIPDVTDPPGTVPSAPTQPAATEPAQTAEPTQPTEPTLPDGTVDTPGEVMGSIYVAGDSAYSLYYFNREGTDRYAEVVNRTHRLLGEGARVFSLPVPLSSGVVLDPSLLAGVGASDQRAAIEYMNSRMEPGVHALNVFDALKKHNAEYLYFRTDHHWTARGAYYAYAELCGEMGVTPHALEQFEKREYPGFLGSFYAETRSGAMEARPDTVEAFVPMGTNSMTFVDKKGVETSWNIVRNADNYASSGKYYCFAGSDQPFSYAHNPAITDGSACLVVKDSFGNAFIPFLIDHYETVYWIDFRYYAGSLPELVREKGIGDVIFCLNIYNTTSAGAVKLLEKLVPET